jgi:2-oxoglutarate ferredoxin oxidoreductase subunit gamma
VLAGQILGRAAFIEGKNVVQTQSYGAEARGSIAKSELIISDGRIGFPAVRKCDVLVAMNQESLDIFFRDLKKGGILIVDASNTSKVPTKGAKVFQVSATEMAKKMFGEKMYANMIMLGALTKITCIVSRKSMEKAIADSISERTVKTNLNAYKKGLELC